MLQPFMIKVNPTTSGYQLTLQEQKEIATKVEQALGETLFRMSIIANLLSLAVGVALVFFLIDTVSHFTLFAWYTALLVTNMLNIMWNFYLRFSRDQWRQGFYIFLAIICLIFGSALLLFKALQTLYILPFLLIVLVGFNFALIVDFKAALISNLFLLILPILVYFYRGITEFSQHFNADLRVATGLILLGLFFIILSNLTSKLIRRFYHLNYTNIFLSHTLDNMSYQIAFHEENRPTQFNLDVVKELQNAIFNDEFIILYQPIIDLKNGRTVGAEALLRWHNPTLGWVTPEEFIPIAEAHGSIIPLNEWIIRTAGNQLKNWHQQGFQIFLALNLSTKQLEQPNFVGWLKKLMDDIGIDPKYIELELSETIAFQDNTIPMLRALKNEGFSLSIDDFGTGYSGLSNLRLFTPDKIKIDQSFIADLSFLGSKAIITNTIALGKLMNVAITAEGIETEEQLYFLIQNNCDLGQGYFFTSPLDNEEFTEMLRKQTRFLDYG